jgi:hypothetical protein
MCFCFYVITVKESTCRFCYIEQTIVGRGGDVLGVGGEGQFWEWLCNNKADEP